MHRLALLIALCVPALAAAAAPPGRTELAIQRGLSLLQDGASRYTGNRRCFSCHHQALTVAALVAAREKGFRISEKVLKEQVEFTLDTFRGRRDRVASGEGVPGNNTTAGYALHTLQVAGHRPDETAAALVDYLVVRQGEDGSWPALMPRPPSEGSRFTNAAHALAGLKHYALDAGAAGERRRKVEAAYRKGKAWLEKAAPADTEDRVFHLRGLVAVGAAPERIGRARRTLERQQHADGSWSQVPGRGGDAYATATALHALRQAGLSRADERYRRGIAYLLRSQSAQGAWVVPSRSRPVQKFFDNGDPGGKDQFISFLATGWATLLLIDAAESQQNGKFR